MSMRITMAVVAVALGATACLENLEVAERGAPTPDASDPDPSDPRVTDPDPSDPDPADPRPTDPDPTQPIDPDPADPGRDPADPLESTTWCTPSAYEPPPSMQLPEIPAEVFDRVCQLESQTTFFSYNGQTDRIAYTWSGDVLWAQFGQGSNRNLLKVVFDAAGHRIEATWGEQKRSSSEPAFAAYDDAHRYRYDTAGNTIEYATFRGNNEHVWMTQRWQEGRLVERHAEQNVYDSASGTQRLLPLHTTWHYDGGRLASASAELGGSIWTAHWTYDPAGRPVRVERRRDGLVYGRMTWEFDAHNRLARRTVLRDPTVELADGNGTGALDTLGQPRYQDWNGDPWADAVPRIDPSGCLVLPTSLDYGYPGGEAVYELGMPRDERPNGIGWAYGADTYGWNYGDLSWYSHAGVHGLEPGYRGWEAKLESEIRYVAGQMVEETVRSSTGPVTEAHRTRAFEQGNLVVDRLDFTVSPEVYDDQTERTSQSYGRELRFDWDIKGSPARLIQRELHDDAEGRLEWQSWSRDLSGRWLSHSVLGWGQWGSRAHIAYYGGGYDPCAEGCEQAATLRVLYSRVLDAAGNTTERTTARPDAQGVLTPDSVETWRYDEAGRMLEARNGAYVVQWQYDGAGRLVRESYDYDGVGEPDGWTDTHYDPAGRWIEKSTWSGGALHNQVTRTFGCEAGE